MNKTASLEVLLFVAGEEGMSRRDLASLLDISPQALEQQLKKLQEKYDADDLSSLTIIETAGKMRLTTKMAFEPLLKSYAKSAINQSVSRSGLEVLSIIAYKQPITRVEIDNIRSVNSSGAISTLKHYNLIEGKGQLEAPGRPTLYGTTDYFLDYIGINSLDELPSIERLEAQTADQEVQLFTEVEVEDEN
jgi:segregation and condensation protein B